MIHAGSRYLCVAGLLATLAGCTLDFDRYRYQIAEDAGDSDRSGSPPTDAGDAGGDVDSGPLDASTDAGPIADAGDAGDANASGDDDTNTPNDDDAPNCKSGFEPDGNKCVDIDECDDDNGGCARLCINSKGSYRCACDPGDELDADQRKCHDVGWDTSNQIVSSVGTTPHVAMDGKGNAMIVWSESDGTRTNIRAERYYVGRWLGTDPIEANSGNASAPRIATDASNTAVAAWVQADGSARTEIWVNRYEDGDWGNATALATDAAGAATAPRVAMDGQGNAVVVWVQVDGALSSIWAASYSAEDTRWGDAGAIEGDEAGDAVQADVAMDESGSAIAIWSQSDGTRTNILSSRYSVSKDEWSDVVPVETSDYEAVEPRLDMDGSGDAIAMWSQRNERSVRDVWSNRYQMSTDAWGTAELLQTDDNGEDKGPDVAMDAFGNALAGWWDEEGGYQIWVDHYESDRSWGITDRINPTGADTIRGPDVGVAASGNGLAVWWQDQPDDAEDGTWYARYELGRGWDSAHRLAPGDSASPLWTPRATASRCGSRRAASTPSCSTEPSATYFGPAPAFTMDATSAAGSSS